MKHARPLPIRLLLVALCLDVAGAPQAQAQAPGLLANGYRNVFTYQPPPSVLPAGVSAPVTGDSLLPAYQAQRQSGTAFGGFPTKGYGTLPTNQVVTQPPDYPQSTTGPGVSVVVVLRSAIIARPLALFAISYNFGAVIPTPMTNNNNQPTDYRAEPLNSRIKTTVVVTSGVETSRIVVDASSTEPDGTTTTSNGNEVTTVTIGQNPAFYWSIYARKVYATQPGHIVIKWREAASTAFIEKTYDIATSPGIAERTIYWTENGFDGPPVEVPAGKVSTVKIIYNTLVPADVAKPYLEPWTSGLVDFTQTDPAKKRYKTFYYENDLIHAYNVEGRVFIEYLGLPIDGAGNEHKGTEIVNIVKEAIPGELAVDLGEELPHLPDENGRTNVLDAKIFAGLGLTATPYLQQQVLPGGTRTTAYAIRETQPGTANAAKTLDNNVLIYWMETSPEGKLNLKWPKQYVGYKLQWPDAPSKYSIYARPDSGATDGIQLSKDTAVQLDSANNPALVYQDDPNSLQAVMLPGNKFYTVVTQADSANRALIRYSKDDDIWFERVYSQLDPYYVSPNDLLKLQQGTPPVPFTAAPGIVDKNIGERIEPAASLGSTAATFDADGNPLVHVGYIHQRSGTAFNVEAYVDPFVAGFDAAAGGAIIGVNAIPGKEVLEVWWYKKSTPTGTKITGTYWPSFVQQYKLRWPTPTPADTIDLASNKGSDVLPSLQAMGKIYTQNEANLPGYNPNEEHALMLNGRAWALRDDLNLTTDNGATDLHWTSSAPYVLLHYTEADQRPAMRVFHVKRGTFEYPAIAGKVLQGPMPLPLLAPALNTDRSVVSYELPGKADTIQGQPLPDSLNANPGTTDSAFAHYQKFTWADRKGIIWVYRGPNEGNDVLPVPTLKMRYFYATQPGFYFPGVSQPPVGTIVPYLRSGAPGSYPAPTFDVAGTAPAARTDQPLDVIFRPQWPDSAPELRVGETLTLPKLGLPQVRGQQSAEFIYQQSVALNNTAGLALADRQKSARLIDPTRAKVYHLGGPASVPPRRRTICRRSPRA